MPIFFNIIKHKFDFDAVIIASFIGDLQRGFFVRHATKEEEGYTRLDHLVNSEKDFFKNDILVILVHFYCKKKTNQNMQKGKNVFGISEKKIHSKIFLEIFIRNNNELIEVFMVAILYSTWAMLITTGSMV